MQWAVLLMLLGAAVRLLHLLLIDTSLPYRSGGLFTEFALQIVAHNYALPHHIPFYSADGLPFAYPPLAFYFDAVIFDLLDPPRFQVVTFVPPLIAVLTLPAFWMLVRALPLAPTEQLAALAAYGLMPLAFVEQIEGAGISEGFGTICMAWLAAFLARSWRDDRWRDHVLAGAAWAGCVLASPGTAFAAVPTVALYVLARWRAANWHWRGFWYPRTILTGVVAVLLSAPYWLTVAARHGVTIYTKSVGAQYDTSYLNELLQTLNTYHAWPGAAWDVLIFAGLLLAIRRRWWALIVPWIGMTVGVPREGKWMIAMPGAILAGMALAEILQSPHPKSLSQEERDLQKSRFPSFLWKKTYRALFSPSTLGRGSEPEVREGVRAKTLAILGLIALLLLAPIIAVRNQVDYNAKSLVTHDHIDALTWADANLPADAVFVILSNNTVIEWSPQIVRRTVLNVPYGTEFEPDEARRVHTLQGLLKRCTSGECVRNSVGAVGLVVESLYVLVDADGADRVADGGITVLHAQGDVHIARIEQP